jgi:hypothetical protein
MIETGDTGIAGLPSIVVGYVAVKARATELTLGLGDFYKAPWGAMTLFGNKGTVSFIDEGPKPDLWPTQVQPGAPTGAYGRTERFVIRSDAALKADDGKECAELITYTDGSWTVSGRMPGATIIQVVPIIDGQVAASPALEIPIPVDLPVLSDPGPFQVQVARENNRARMQYVGGQSTTLTEQPTPIPLDGGAVDQRWRWPDGWGTVPGNVLTQHTTTRELDAVAEIGFFHLAQYLPVREGGIPWHYPVSNPDDSIFKLPPETTGSGASRDLGYLTLAKIWALDPSAGDAWVQRRLRESGPPQELWRRWWKRFSNAGFVSRTSIEEMQQRRLVEVRARQAMDQVTIARLKRWFSMAWDYRDPARVVTPPAAAWVGDGVANQGIAMLGRTSGSSQPIMVEVSRSLWEWVTDGLGFSDPLSRLLDTALTPGWSIGHPFTEEVVRHMMDERLSAAAAVVERLRQAGKPPGHEDFPVRLATDTDVLGDGTGDTAMSRQPLMVHLVTRPDGVTTEVVIALPSTAVTMYGGSNGIGARQAYQRNGFIYPYLLVGPQNTMDLRITGEAVFDDGDEPHLYVGRWDEAAGKAVEVDYVRVRASDDDGALIVRALQEVSLLRRMLDDRVAYAATQDLRNDAPISFFLYTVGDFISPVGDIYKAAWGADVLTGETLSNGDRALAGAFAALEIIPGVVSLTGKVAGRAGKGLRAGSRTIGQDVAKTAARNTADTADQRVKDAVAQMTEEGQERGVAAGARRPQGFQRLADNAFIDGVQRAARFMDMDATDVLKRHVGLGRVGRMMLAKKGSMAPLVTAAHSTANAAQRALPPSWLVRGTDGRTAKATMETVDDLHVLEEVIASYRAAHGDKACAEFMEEIQQAACFPAGTLVETADRGWQPIERVRIDDHVVTRSDEGPDRPLMAGRVSRVMVSHTPVLVQARLAASGATRLLRATPEHPVYAEGRGWIPLAAAEPGDRLLGGSEPVVVQEIQVEDLPAPIAVYNLAIDDAHTYRVGVLADDGGLPTAIWVHNKCVWLSVAEERVRLLYRADPTKRTPAEWMEIVRDSHLEMMANVKLLSRRGKVAWRIAPSPSRVDKASANTKLRMINGPGNSKNLRKRMQKVMGLDAIPPGMEAHHLVPKEIAANHRSFLAKIGFDIDNPRNGTFLPDSQLSGPRGPGQKQAAHIDNHPKYREAMDEVMGKVSDDFEDAVEGIGLMKNTSEYRDAYAKIVSDFQEKVSRIQIAARDNLQKGAPLSGNDQAVKDYWTNKLGKVIK